jgi:hypothetical protein
VRSLAAGPVNFGSLPVGQSPTIEVLLLNQTSAPLPAPSASVTGVGFSPISQTPAGTVVKPAASVALEIQFSPAVAGVLTGTLTLGGQTFALTGTGVILALPLPSIVLTLALPDSAQQGTAAVNLRTISQTTASGTVTLAFVIDPSVHAAGDRGIAFANGGQSATFNVFMGTKQGAFGLANSLSCQTGTTAGTLTVSVAVGG